MVGTTLATEGPKKVGRKGVPNHPIDFRREIAKLANEPGVSVARLAMERGLNANLVFKWRRSLRAGEYDPVGLVPVHVQGPEVPAVLSSSAPASAGTLELSVGRARLRIEGKPDEATLALVLRLLCPAPGSSA